MSNNGENEMFNSSSRIPRNMKVSASINSTLSQSQSTSTYADPHTQSISRNNGNVDTATHIVVEHHHSGTVKTHVFSSKDGNPSILGHTLPDLNNFNTISESFDEKIQSLSTVVQDSIEIARKDSLDNFEALRISLESSKCRVASHVSQATSCTIENQIKTTLVPRLDKIESLLQRDFGSEISSRTEASSEYTSTNEMKSEAARESKNSFNERNNEPYTSEFRYFTRPFRPNENQPLNEKTLLDKLFMIENNVDALCRVVIDGKIPTLPTGNNSEHGSSSTNYYSESLDMNAINRIDAMRSEMLGFPEMLQDMFAAMKELSKVLTSVRDTDQRPSQYNETPQKEVEGDHSRMHEEQKQWQFKTLQVLGLQTDELEGLAADVQSLDTSFQELYKEFNDWRRAHKLNLQVYLKYMFHIYRHTRDSDIRIQRSIKEFKEQMMVNIDQQDQIPKYLDVLRADILTALNYLPDVIVNQLKLGERAADRDKDQQFSSSQMSNDSLQLTTLSPKSGFATEPERHRSLSVSTTKHSEQGEQLSQTRQSDTSVRIAPSTTIPISGSLIENLVETTQALQSAITTVLEKCPGNSMYSAQIPSDTVSDISLSQLKSYQEKWMHDIDERLDHDLVTQSRSDYKQDADTSTSSKASSITATIVPRASGYIQSTSTEVNTRNNKTDDKSVPKDAKEGDDSEDASITRSLEFTQDLQSMNKNLTQLVEIVKRSSEDLKNGQIQLRWTSEPEKSLEIQITVRHLAKSVMVGYALWVVVALWACVDLTQALFCLCFIVIISAIITAIIIPFGGDLMDNLFGGLKQLFRHQQMLQDPQVELKLGKGL
ncbi:hypothetical protein BGZ76_005912 [Entomortierella beljakovae]|nr:hypothetical protein BGZ76_005912 [Entomortierella beljakovae]